MKHNPITLFGEVLFDQFPDGQAVLGGAPFMAFSFGYGKKNLPFAKFLTVLAAFKTRT